jgi:hypothetical protein
VLLLILVAVIPAWASFHLAYREELRLFVKEGQINFARGMAEREDRVRELYSSANLTTIHPERVESFIARRLKENNLDVYVAFFFDTSIGTPPSEHSEYQNESENGLISFFASFVPLFDQSSIERHGLARSQSADRSWFWEEKPPDELVLHVRGALTPSHRSSPQHIVSVVPDVRPPIYWWLIWPVIILSLAILVSYLIRRIFLFHIQKPPVRLLSEYYTGGITQNLFLVLGSPFTSKSEILEDFENEKRLTIIDIQEQARKKKWAERYDFDGANSLAVVLDNFDYCHDDPAANEQKLVLLETLYQRQTRAIAISAFEPHDYLFSSGKAEEGAEENSPSPTVAEERWAGILSRFLKVRMEDVGKADKFGDLIETLETNVKKRTDLTGEDKERMETVLDIVKRECSPLACLQSTGREILKQPKFDELTPADIVIEIRAQTLTYYQALWRASTNDEKLTLSHLAQDGLLSPNDQEIEGLMRRGLIVRDPDVRIMNETFESFVMDRGQDTLIAACEKEARGNSSWQALKVPFALILGTIIVFLFVTQRDLYNSALAIVAAVTAGVPTLFKLFGSSGSNSGPSTKS